MESLLAENEAPKKATSNKAPDKHATTAKKQSGTAATERQRVMEENRKEAEAAQKIVDDQKEKARLEEENKKLKAELQKSKITATVTDDSPRTPSVPQKKRLSNTVRRVVTV